MVIIIASLLQSLLLPGMLLLAGVRGLGLADRLLLAAPLSLVANYFLVMLLVVFGMFTTELMRQVVAIEVALLAFVYVRAAGCGPAAGAAFSDKLAVTVWRMLIGALVLAASLKTAGWPHQLGTAITDWDGVVSWYRWGQDLYRGELPVQGTWSYPHVVTAQYASMLKIAGSAELHILPKLLPLSIVVLLALTALRVGFLAAPGTYWRILIAIPGYFYFTRITVNSDYLFSGGADIAISYFAILAAYVFLLDRAGRERLARQDADRIFVVGAAIIASSLLVKQIGVVVATSFLALYFFHERKAEHGKRNALIALALTAAIPLHWYWHLVAKNHSSVDTSIYTSLLNADLLHRVMAALNMIYQQLGPVHLTLVLLGASLRPRILLVPVLLNLAIWIPFVSYDTRGLYPVLPLFAYFWASALVVILSMLRKLVVAPLETLPPFGALTAWRRRGASAMAERIATLSQGARRIRLFLVPADGGNWKGMRVAVLFLGLAVAFRFQTASSMDWALSRSKEAVMEYGQTPQLNRYLVNQLMPNMGEGERLATDYQIVRYLPGIGPRYTDFHTLDLGYLAQAFASTHNRYILITNTARPDVVAFLENAADGDELSRLATYHGYSLYKINRPAGNCAIYRQLDPTNRWGPCE